MNKMMRVKTTNQIILIDRILDLLTKIHFYKDLLIVSIISLIFAVD